MPTLLQLSPRLPLPPDDGGKIETWNFSRCLHYNGYDIDLICYAKDPTDEIKHSAKLSKVFASVVTVTKNMERQYPLNMVYALTTRSSYFVRKFWDAAYARHVRKQLSVKRYDATMINSAFMGVYLSVLRQAGEAAGKLIIRQHNVEYEILARLSEHESGALIRGLLRREANLFKQFELQLLDEVDEVLTITRRDANVFDAAGVKKPMTVVNAFIDVEKYRIDPSIPIQRHSIVHVGNMAWIPNINGLNWFLDHVWPDVVQRYPDARFYIVGKNPPASLRRLSGGSITVTGYVEDERPLIQQGHVFIVPLLEGSGVRIKILTAMAMGKAVLSTTRGAEGIDWEGLIIRNRPAEWITAISQQFETTPLPVQEAATYIRDHYDWRRQLSL